MSDSADDEKNVKLQAKALEGFGIQGGKAQDYELHADPFGEPASFQATDRERSQCLQLRRYDPEIDCGTHDQQNKLGGTGVAAIRSGDVTPDLTPENVAKRWMVGMKVSYDQTWNNSYN